MFRKKILRLVITFILLFCICGAKSLSPREMDLNTIKLILDKYHPNPYINISEKEFLDKIKKLNGTMTNTQFYYGLRELVSLIEDSHTSIDFINSQTKYETIHALDFAIAEFDNKWYLFIANKDNEKLLGQELLLINSTTIQAAFEKALKIIPNDNIFWAKNNFSNTINFQEALIYLGIASPNEPVILTLKSKDGKISKMETAAYSSEQINQMNIVQYQPKIYAPTQLKKNYYYWANPLRNQTFFIQYNICRENPQFPMDEFAKTIKQELKKNKYKKIIIDLRYNTGGNSEVISPLLKMLKDQQNIQKFKVYTLIGSSTFSSAVLNTWDTKTILNSTLVGTPTGGNINHFGEVRSVQLTSLPLVMNYSTKYFNIVPNYTKGAIYPDVKVNQLLEDYNNGIDSPVEWIIIQ
ncbi:MAG: hypothetical protein ATN32_00555 [Candidatus Epulonipiscium fishelsonii]|nr:MAG: hypothetical protein ATN32_00555 [Epulopiscium sp. AS2M-Bin002]